jgi:hypothetical protein
LGFGDCWGGVHFKAPSLAVKGAFGVASRLLRNP